MKKLFSFFIMPLSVILLLLLCAIIFHKRFKRLSWYCLLSSTGLLLISTLPFVSDTLTRPIENNYPAFIQQTKPVDYIVILGCGHTSDKHYPATSELKACSLQRMVEGLRIYHLHPEATIITSGAAFTDEMSNAEKVKQALLSLNVSDEAIITESRPKDTEQEAELISPLLQHKNVVLVTNADHMPRAIDYFNQQNVQPIAAPCSPMVKDYYGNKGWAYFLPSSYKLQQTTIAWYETLGSIVQWLKKLF